MISQFNWFDFCLVGFISFSLLIGFARGLVQEVSSIANWVLGIWSGVVFYEQTATYLPLSIQSPTLRYGLGFLLIFALVLIVATLISKLVRVIIRSIGLKGPDQILGALFGVLRGVVFIALFALVMRESTFSQHEGWQRSLLLNKIMPISEWLASLIPYNF